VPAAGLPAAGLPAAAGRVGGRFAAAGGTRHCLVLLWQQVRHLFDEGQDLADRSSPCVGDMAGMALCLMPCSRIQYSSASSKRSTACFIIGGVGFIASSLASQPGSTPGAPWHVAHICL
jgi:hypothetical protein